MTKQQDRCNHVWTANPSNPEDICCEICGMNYFEQQEPQPATCPDCKQALRETAPMEYSCGCADLQPEKQCTLGYACPPDPNDCSIRNEKRTSDADKCEFLDQPASPQMPLREQLPLELSTEFREILLDGLVAYPDDRGKFCDWIIPRLVKAIRRFHKNPNIEFTMLLFTILGRTLPNDYCGGCNHPNPERCHECYQAYFEPIVADAVQAHDSAIAAQARREFAEKVCKKYKGLTQTTISEIMAMAEKE